MSLTREEAIRFFNSIDASDKVNGRITKSDLEKAVAVDTDGDGEITDIPQSRVLPNGTTTTWTEKEIQKKNVDKWIENAAENWKDDQSIDLNEFLSMMRLSE